MCCSSKIQDGGNMSSPVKVVFWGRYTAWPVVSLT